MLVLVAALIIVGPHRHAHPAVHQRARPDGPGGGDTAAAGQSRQSQLDLTMAALYFSRRTPRSRDRWREVEAIWDSGLAVPIPLHLAFATNGFRIVGTTLDYFDFRDLTIAEGRGLAVLGDAVIGAEVARDLGMASATRSSPSPQNLFDLDGVYPLEMPIVGVLAPTGSPDDEADLRGYQDGLGDSGIGHGHEDVVTGEPRWQAPRSPAAIVQYQRITHDNIDSFHFHGDTRRLSGVCRHRRAE